MHNTSGEVEMSREPSRPIRISIVDDDSGVRKTLIKLLEGVDDFEFISEHESGEDAVAKLPELLPDVVLMDINLGRTINGIHAVARIRKQTDEIQFIMLTAYEETDKILLALKAGATGYLLKRTQSEELYEGIRQVMRGESPMSGPIARKLIRNVQGEPGEPSLLERLTPKERLVLALLAEGRLYKEVANHENITINTARTHIRSIYEKLEVTSKAEAVRLWVENEDHRFL